MSYQQLRFVWLTIKLLDGGLLSQIFLLIWEQCLTQKVGFFGWLLLHRRSATKTFMLQWGCNQISDNTCPRCEWPEDIDHILIHCEDSISVWNSFFSWLGILLTVPSTSYSFLLHWRSSFKPGPFREFGTSLLLITSWLLWKRRNQFIFQKTWAADDLMLQSVHLCWFIFNCNRRPVCFLVSNHFINLSMLVNNSQWFSTWKPPSYYINKTTPCGRTFPFLKAYFLKK